MSNDAVSNDRKRFRRAIEASHPGATRGGEFRAAKVCCAGEGLPATTSHSVMPGRNPL